VSRRSKGNTEKILHVKQFRKRFQRTLPFECTEDSNIEYLVLQYYYPTSRSANCNKVPSGKLDNTAYRRDIISAYNDSLILPKEASIFHFESRVRTRILICPTSAAAETLPDRYSILEKPQPRLANFATTIQRMRSLAYTEQASGLAVRAAADIAI
jgi:hypothetical protein